MSGRILLINLAGVLTAAGPVVFAVMGETICERAGVINLSMNGTILLSAMGSFAVALESGSVVLGFLAGALIGAAMALVVAFFGITLRQSQVAVGFVLALLGRDLSYFLGSPLMGQTGPRLSIAPLPLVENIPVAGVLLFRQDVMTYLSFLLIIIMWVFIYRTRAGLMLRGVGDRPAAAFVRGGNVRLHRYVYTVLGGALAGLAGPIFSLSVKAGWSGSISGLDGIGWIVLAITIFGGWDPLRAALGAYLFAFLQWLGLVLQPALPGVPAQVLQVAPFPLMILTLLVVNLGNAEWVERILIHLPSSARRPVERALRALNVRPPGALGAPFDTD